MAFSIAMTTAFKIIHDLMVPKAQDAVTLSDQVGCAPLVVLLQIHVLAAIHFDDQLKARGVEVDDKRADGVLAAKAGAGSLALAQHGPQADFGGGGVGAQFVREAGGVRLAVIGHVPLVCCDDGGL